MDMRQWTLSADPKLLGMEPTTQHSDTVHEQCYVSQSVGIEWGRIKTQRDRKRVDLKKWDRDSKKWKLWNEKQSEISVRERKLEARKE
jgi:hypothetical protein